MAGYDNTHWGRIVALATVVIFVLGAVASAGGHHGRSSCSTGFRGGVGIGHAGFGIGHRSTARFGGSCYGRSSFSGGTHLSGSFLHRGSHTSVGLGFTGGHCYTAPPIYRRSVFPRSYYYGRYGNFGFGSSYVYRARPTVVYPSEYYNTDFPIYVAPDANVQVEEVEPAVEGGERAPSTAADSFGPADLERARQAGVALGRGDKAFERGDYDDAREEYVRALVLADGDPRGQIALGLAEFARGNFADAARAIRVGVDRASQLAESSLNLADAYGKKDDLVSHRAALSAYLESHPNDPDAWFLSGFVSFFSGDRPGGVAVLQKSRELSASDSTHLDGGAFIEKAEQAVRRQTPSTTP